ncbi:hypothetical protein MKW94_013039 [Papaver nudicaule]|uniref:S-protein homolog n=1 Tax=Papaver nudicaule TaxID=74823 RepID=A0AA42B1G2_PAPNU|nr:hypothetical protein [Papaver nudicaule]MCL7047952.1 hypothetical protein [Papaver nudicaule]
MACFFISGNGRSTLVSARFFFLVVLSIFVGFSSVTDGFGIAWQKTTVVVRNDLPPNTMLAYHCKSANDDLGERYLASNTEWSWSFKVNFWDTTLYWCNFGWNENGKPRQEGYKVFKGRKDVETCGVYCYRSIRSDGIYDFEGTMIHKWP